MSMKNTSTIFMLIGFLTLSSCANRIDKAVRSAKYSAWEMVGVEKRDLFKREVSNIKEDQEETGESFKDALTQLQEIYAFDGGNIERQYKKLNSSYEDSQEKATEVSASIIQLDKVANDLFVEWEKEIEEISSKDLRKNSKTQLSATRSRYKKLHAQLKKSESKMAPVLTKLKDQSLYLKHNLNAKAIAGLKAESGKIESDIDSLIKEMNVSINEADEFIKTME